MVLIRCLMQILTDYSGARAQCVDFCRAMLYIQLYSPNDSNIKCKCGLDHTVSVCVCVCLSVTFVNSVKTSNHMSNVFHRRVVKLF